VHRLVLVTRNVSDVLGRGVDILDPFKKLARLQGRNGWAGAANVTGVASSAH
jgi:hypothetical protein